MSSLSCCSKGGILPGEPTGHVEQVAGVETYVAKGPEGADASKAIVLFTDAFGLGLVNNKIISDTIAKATGITVYVPNLFGGTPLDWTTMDTFPGYDQYKKDQAALGFFGRVFSTIGMIATFLPFLVRHYPSRKKALIENFLRGLPETSIGLSGYCYGGAVIDLATKSDSAEKIKSIYVAHASFLKPADIIKWNHPVSVSFAEWDMQMSKEGMLETEAGLKARNGPPSEAVHYPDTIHGWAARPSKETYPAFEKALKQGIDWHKRFV